MTERWRSMFLRSSLAHLLHMVSFVRWKGKATAHVNYTNLIFCSALSSFFFFPSRLSAQEGKKVWKYFLVHFYMSLERCFAFAWSVSGTHQERQNEYQGERKKNARRLVRVVWSLNRSDCDSPFSFRQQFFSSFIFHFVVSMLVVMNFTWKFIKNRAINIMRRRGQRKDGNVCARDIEMVNCPGAGWWASDGQEIHCVITREAAQEEISDATNKSWLRG